MNTPLTPAPISPVQEIVAEMRADGDAFARQVGSSLYHLTTAVAMAWEAGQTASARRMQLAQLVLRQRMLPQDPLGGDEVEPELGVGQAR